MGADFGAGEYEIGYIRASSAYNMINDPMRNFLSCTIPMLAPQASARPRNSPAGRFQVSRIAGIRSFILLVLLVVGVAHTGWAQGEAIDGSKPKVAKDAKKVVVKGVVWDHDYTKLSGIEVVLTADEGLVFTTHTNREGRFKMVAYLTDDYVVHAIRGDEETRPMPDPFHLYVDIHGNRVHDYSLSFEDPPYRPKVIAEELKKAEAAKKVEKQPGYHIHGTVLEADGSPAKGVEMRVSSALGKFFKLPIDENGRFSFRSEGDESFWIHPIQTIGNATTSHGGKKVTPAIAQAWGEKGLIFTLPPAAGQDDWYADNGYVMVGMADQESDQEEVVDTLAQPNKANASAPLKLEVFPNLDLGTMDLNLNVPVNTKLMMRFIGPEGQEIYSQEFVFGPDQSVFLPIGRRPAGVYTIELRDARGQTVSQQLHVK